MTGATARRLSQLQDRLLALLGNSAQGRAPLVAGMLRRDASEATSYWLQLVVSVGIATLGLVVGSAAVVIGAMLVAPLMGPIVGLAMGLATGSPFLVLRSAGRIGGSVLVAVAGAALITQLLPFHELNSEIAARTSPTVLDLITAGFCALAGVYAALRPGGSDTATTAAGTSISISLVPPLCASGYGFGTLTWSVAGGAMLLFLTNLVAIVVIGTVSFVAAGFGQVEVVALEREELKKEVSEAKFARALARRLSRLFESRWGPVLRFLMPFALLAAVYVPLRSALDEVAWQVRVRAAVRETIAREPMRVVQSRVRVERHEVDVVVVVLGKAADAERIRATLDGELRKAAGVTPRIEVFAVADANAIAGLESSLLSTHRVETPTVPQPSPEEQLDDVAARMREIVTGVWPKQVAGTPLAIELGTEPSGPLGLRITHLGAPLSAEAQETLRLAIGKELAREVEISAVALPSTQLTRDGGDLALVAQVSSALRVAAGLGAGRDVRVCVTRPADRRRPPPADLALAAALDAALSSFPKVTTVAGASWAVQFVVGDCPPPQVAPGPPPGPLAPR